MPARGQRIKAGAAKLYRATVLAPSDWVIRWVVKWWPVIGQFEPTLPRVLLFIMLAAVPAQYYGYMRPVLYGTSLVYLVAQAVILFGSVHIARRWVFVSRKGKEGEERLVMVRRLGADSVEPKYRCPNVSVPQVIRWDILGAATSNFAGKMSSVPLPKPLRVPAFKAFARFVGANLDEVGAPLESFTSMQDFFTRPIKEGVRPISPALLTSPVDGRVVVCGRVTSDQVEQVKGVNYSISQFLGRDHASLLVHSGILDGDSDPTMGRPVAVDSRDDESDNDSLYSEPMFDADDFEQTDDIPMVLGQEVAEPVERPRNIPERHEPLVNQATALFHCVIYLAPGDYHRIHSPADIDVSNVRHFPGTVFPISPVVARLIPNLFSLNERVVMSGSWKWGHFSYVAVGAYNVGSIEINFDKAVKTNKMSRDFRCPNLKLFSYGGGGCFAYDRHYDGVHLEKGGEVGKFKLGSTVVMIFEAPQNFRFNVEPGQKVKLGQPLGDTVDADGKPYNYAR